MYNSSFFRLSVWAYLLAPPRRTCMKLPRFSESYLLVEEPARCANSVQFRPSWKLRPGGQIQLGGGSQVTQPESPGVRPSNAV